MKAEGQLLASCHSFMPRWRPNQLALHVDSEGAHQGLPAIAACCLPLNLRCAQGVSSAAVLDLKTTLFELQQQRSKTEEKRKAANEQLELRNAGVAKRAKADEDAEVSRCSGCVMCASLTVKAARPVDCVATETGGEGATLSRADE